MSEEPPSLIKKLEDEIKKLRADIEEMLKKWNERLLEYEQEWRDATGRTDLLATPDRLAAADIAAEVRVCIGEVRAVIAQDQAK